MTTEKNTHQFFHSGTIELVNQFGKGSTFRFIFLITWGKKRIEGTAVFKWLGLQILVCNWHERLVAAKDLILGINSVFKILLQQFPE